MTAVEKRIRAAMERFAVAEQVEAAADEKEGRKAGHDWAVSKATPRALRGLARSLEEGGERSAVELAEEMQTTGIYGALTLAYHTMPKSEVDREECERFFANAGVPDNMLSNPNYLGGFVDAAIEVWDKYQSERS